ncbi:MAG: hypothetical protein IJ246_07905 [Clostridia bacterium]|nr:hypothetical protein [Clostridia bacterium]
MRHLACLLCLLCLSCIISPVQAEDAALEGTLFYPSGSTPDNAILIYHYRFPCPASDDICAEGIRAQSEYAWKELSEFTVPILGESLTFPTEVTLDYVCTCDNDAYVSYRYETTTVSEDTHSVVWAAHVFARTGSKAGLIISLPDYLGLLTAEDHNDTWLENRQTEKCNRLVREKMMQALSGTDLPELEDAIAWDFYPEEDFFLDADGEPVFFLQPDLFPSIDTPLTLKLTRQVLSDEL